MSETKYRIAIFASGSGTNAEEIFKYFSDHKRIEVGVVLCNKSSAYVLQRAEKFGIPARVFTNEQFAQSTTIEHFLSENKITHIVLAGFLRLIPPSLIRLYENRIINIHPALLPKYGGTGMYGMKIHEAVKTSSDAETGITIHLVNERYDEGKIVFQARCPVGEGDSPEDIANKIHQLEYRHYPKSIEEWILKS